MNEFVFHPEDKARFLIDKRLLACGWLNQSKAEMNLFAAPAECGSGRLN
jgi:type I restriction enzyme R subunit